MRHHLPKILVLLGGMSLASLQAGTPVIYPENAVVTDPLELTGPTTELNVATGTAEQAGSISGTDPSSGVTKTGLGHLIFSGVNTYTGATLISEGTLQIQGIQEPVLLPSAVTVASGATLVIAQSWEVEIGSLAGSGNVVLQEDQQLALGGDNLSTTFSGILSSSGEGTGLTKTGSGTLTLTGTVTLDQYLELCHCTPNNRLEIVGGTVQVGTWVALLAGTLVVEEGGSLTTQDLIADGTLKVSGAGSSINATDVRAGLDPDGTSLVEVSHGATLNADTLTISINAVLQGDGTINAATVIEEGSRLAPGHSAGEITFTTGLELQGGSALELELGSISDLILVTGGTLAGEAGKEITLNLSDAGGFTAGSYTFIDFTGSSLLNLDEHNFLFGQTIAGYTFSIERDATQFRIIAQAIPEPSQLITLGALAAPLYLLRKRRRRVA